MTNSLEEFNKAREEFSKECPAAIAPEDWSQHCKDLNNKNAQSSAETLTKGYADGASLLKEFGKSGSDVITQDEMKVKYDELTQDVDKNWDKINTLRLITLALSQSDNHDMTAQRYDTYLAKLRTPIK
jgi:hypothetical protein